MENNLIITPETKISALLKHYPDLEDTLIAMAPAFSKLRQPVLRKTVARITSIRQAAKLGNVPLATMINELRAKVGQTRDFVIDDHEKESQPGAPDWVKNLTLTRVLDARPIIEAGRQPLEQVMKDLAQLQHGERYELMTPFLPAPLIDTAKNKGFQVWSYQEEPGLFRTCFVNG